MLGCKYLAHTTDDHHTRDSVCCLLAYTVSLFIVSTLLPLDACLTFIDREGLQCGHLPLGALGERCNNVLSGADLIMLQ